MREKEKKRGKGESFEHAGIHVNSIFHDRESPGKRSLVYDLAATTLPTSDSTNFRGLKV